MGEDRDRDRVRVGVRGEVNMGKETVQESKPKGLTRREFLKAGVAAAAGIAAGLILPDLI